jgi:hypothetical protein
VAASIWAQDYIRDDFRTFPGQSIPLSEMTGDQKDVLAASTSPERTVEVATAIDADELTKARLDERWREFCLNAEQYVAETTRPSTRVRQPAST